MTVDQTIETEAPADAASPAPATGLAVSGMTCGNCVRHVTEALQSVPGVASATVKLDAPQASVRWKPGAKAEVAALVTAVAKAGYEAKPLTQDEPGCEHCHSHDEGEHQLAGWQINLWIGVLGTLPLMIGEWFLGWAMTPWFQWASFAVAGVVQVFAGAQFYRGAWRQLKVGNSNMDTLVALGSTTAFAYSAWALSTRVGGHLYFMEAASIITLVSVGHWIESRVSVQASSTLRHLLELAPARARRRAADGTETEVPVAQLRTGDLVGLRPGDRVPTDGEVVKGESALDEAMLTGESAPAAKAVGSQVYAGTVNLDGRLVMRVTATGEATALAAIVAAVQRAQTSRAGIQRLGDQVSSIFVPIIVTIAVAAGLWWGLAPESAQRTHEWLARWLWPAHPPVGLAAGFIIASAVLIVACPCAMGLATPAAIMAGSNAAARRGILIRDGVALEKAGQVSAILFDKTGTLTTGKLSVVQEWSRGSDLAPPRRLAAALARNSAHPISQAIARLSTDRLELPDWQELRGDGVQAKPKQGSQPGALARLGSLRWLHESGVDLTPGQAFIEEWSAQGATIVGLASGNSLEGLFAVKDTLKPGAREVVAQLRQAGQAVFLITGDQTRTAANIAQQAGIPPENVFAEVRPEQKAEFVKKLQAQGLRVAFVGDGINDAPALAQADLGIAVSRASDVAREAADIILLKSEIEAVPECLGLARATLRTIKQNLFWAFFYNSVGVPLAALGFMSPILCAAAMGLSDLVVIGNALRLRGWRLKRR